MMRRSTQGVFTGWHMLAVMVAFFGVIIAVNLTMAFLANRSWTGFVVQNTYVASQEFNAKAAAARKQAALGWSGDLTIRDGQPRYALADREGRPVALTAVTLKFMRPVDDREDQLVTLARDGDGTFTTDLRVADGMWLVEVAAEAGLEAPYRETRRIRVIEGGAS